MPTTPIHRGIQSKQRLLGDKYPSNLVKYSSPCEEIGLGPFSSTLPSVASQGAEAFFCNGAKENPAEASSNVTSRMI